jgi:iterative type I PKS product template protein
MFQATGGSNVEDYTPTVVQLANTCMQLALARLWIAWGIEPEAVVGHSLGEYAALNVAGVISDADTIYLVGRRAQLLQEKCNRGTHSMLAVLQSKDTVTRLLAGKDYEIACINAPEETVLAGTSQCIQDVQKTLSSHKIKTMLLRVPFAFHSAQVTPILDSFRDVAKGVTFHSPKIPVVCPLLGNVVSQDGVFGPEYLARHSREPVNMLQALHSANQAGIITEKCAAIEFGPQPVVSKLVKATLGPKIRVLSTLRRNNDTWQILAEGLSTFYTAGAEIRWDEYHRDFHASHKVLSLPAYCWDLKPYWMQYVHDWSLFKGDPRVVAPAPAPAPAVVEIPKLESTTIHRIVEEKETDGKFRIVVEADITRPDLYPLVQGHKVEGVALCTPSVYADIAFTLGDYLLDRFKPPFAERIVDVNKKEIEKALIVQEAGPQLLRAAAEVNWFAKEALLRFYSVDAKGRQTVQHSHCEIRFTDKALFSAVQKDIPRVKARMDEMRENSRSGKTYRFNGQMAYNMVQSVAEFHPDYKCIDEAILDNETLEVACHVNFSRMKKGGTFHTHPGALDGLTQSGGFAMNANEKVKIDAELFVSHGWDGFQIFEKVTHERRYETLVHMKMVEKGLWKGDVVILSGDNLVAFIKGVTAQGVPRRLLRYILKGSTNALPEGGVAKANKAEPGKPKPHTRPAASTPVPASVKASAPSREVATPAKQAPVATISQKQVLQAAPAAPTGNRGTTSDSAALKILAEESGVDQADLGDDVAFADIGVDSLLSLVIGSRFRDELSLDLEPENLFTQCPTVKELKALFSAELEASSAAVNGEVPTPSAVKAIAVNQEYSPEEQDAAQQTMAHDSTSLSQASPASERQVDAEPAAVSPLMSADSGPGSASFASVLQIIAEESGVAVQDLGDDVVLADIGVDSLLALVIGSRIRDEMSADLDVETMLVAFPTVKDLKSRFGDGHPLDNLHEVNSSSSSLSSTFEKVEMDSDVFTPKSEASESGILVSAADSNVPPTTSVVLQGLPKSARQTIFLFPDGCGSATSYAGIPRVSSDTAVVGLNSPYLRNPHEMTTRIDDLIISYLNEVLRRQPSGPYHFGGWSIGGILAYRASQRLLNEGECVHSLILIDSPAPNCLAKLPQHFYDYCDTVGLFGQGTGKAPEWLVPHFMASNNLMSEYYAAPLPHGKAPKTTIIWAGESGVPDYVPRPGDPEDVKFLTVSRTDFSVGPWGRLFPGSEVNVETAVGANHFSMMHEEKHARKLAAFLEHAMA